MKICPCCGKELRNGNDSGWHKACIRNFFGTEELPDVHIDEEILKKLVCDNVRRGLTVPGVQKKLSLHLSDVNRKPQLSLVGYPTGYILKPPVQEYPAMPEAEDLVMRMAKETGISVVPHALIGNQEPSYITKRIDRIVLDAKAQKLAMEDFCQLDLRQTQEKYKGSYERCAKIIRRYSSQVMLDLSELYLRLVFSFVVGNSDMHLKNFSLIEMKPGSGDYVLSPAYDLLPVNILLPADTEEMALTMNGKKQHLHRKDFLVFAESCELTKTAAEKMLGKVLSMQSRYLEMNAASLLPNELKERFARLIQERCQTIQINI